MIPLHGWLALTLSALLGSHLLMSMCAATSANQCQSVPISANHSRLVSIRGSRRQSAPLPAHVDVRAQRGSNIEVANAVDERHTGVRAMIALRQRIPVPARSHLLISGNRWQLEALSRIQSQSAAISEIPPRTPSGRRPLVAISGNQRDPTSHAIRPSSSSGNQWQSARSHLARHPAVVL